MATLFIADLHLCVEEPAITAGFLRFLAGDARKADALYILGDLFEAWIGDDDPTPLHHEIAAAIKSLVDSGVPCFFIHGNRDFLLEIALAAGRRRKILINKVPAKKGSDLSDVLGAVYFCPEDLLLIRDGAAARRKFMDDALCQLRARYAQALSDYHRVYEHKTRILRDSEEYPSLLDTLPEFDLRMAQSGAVIIYYRARFCERLKEYASIAHRECSGGREELGVEYQTVSTISDPLAPIETIYDQLRAHQASHAAAERASRMCLSGPHKDDIAVTIGGVNARQFSSQGQTRTAALAFKLAEREIYREITSRTPLLLLDDVLSELDPRRQEYVLNRILGGQVFITCCEEDRLGTLLSGKVFHIADGKVV